MAEQSPAQNSAQNPAHNPEPGLLERAKGFIEDVKDFIEKDQQKWGGMSLNSHGRLGLSELREVFSPGGNIAQQTPYGMWGTLTPGEVAAGRGHGVHGPTEAAPAHEGGSVYGPNLQASAVGPASPEEIADRHHQAAQGKDNTAQPQRSPEEIADIHQAGKGQDGAEQPRSPEEIADNKPPAGYASWAEYVKGRSSQGNQSSGDTNEQEKVRSLPIEQNELDKGRGR